MRITFKCSSAGLDERYLKHIRLSGREAYFRQGFDGSSSVIAVVDTGVDPKHPELKGRVIDLLNYCGYGKGVDDNGHGTHVAGTITGENVGISKAKILSVKVLDGAGCGEIDDISKALEELADWKDSKGRHLTAVSMSLSTDGKHESVMQLNRFEKAIEALTEKGIAVICSAGNTGKYENRYPASFEDPITVGALDSELNPVGFSTENKEVDVSQIGYEVLSAWYKGGYAVLSGTSMSTPVVSGIAALIADKFYKLFGFQIPETVLYWMLKLNTRDVGRPGLDPKTGAGFCSLQPMHVDLYTHVGDEYMILNGTKVPLRAGIAVVPPGVTSLPARELFADCLGGLVEWNPETRYARFRL